MPDTRQRPSRDNQGAMRTAEDLNVSVRQVSDTRGEETAYDRLLDALRAHGNTVRANTTTATAQCPAHDDRNPSLSIRATEGQALVYCHAGCSPADVLSALDLSMRDLFDDPAGATYRYDDGRRVHRSPDKQFRQSGN